MFLTSSRITILGFFMVEEVTRRGALGRIGAGLGALAVFGLSRGVEAKGKLVKAKPSGERFDVAYKWDSNLDDILEHKEDVSAQLGENAAKNLRVVLGDSGNYGLVYRMNGDERRAMMVAASHSKVLKSAGLGEANATNIEGHALLNHVSYGERKNSKEARKLLGTVYKALGTGVQNKLVIEKTPAGKFRVVYHRFGSDGKIGVTIDTHAKLLKPSNITPVKVIAENNPITSRAKSFHKYHPDEKVEEKKEVNDEPEVKPSTPSKVSKSEGKLEDKVRAKMRARLRKGETCAFYVYNLKTGTVELALNADTPMQQASMVKTQVVGAFLDKADNSAKDKVKYDAVAKRHAQRSIQKSKNDSTNWLFSKAGGVRAVSSWVKKFPSVFKKTSIVENIPGGGQTYRNKASAADHGRELAALWRGALPNSKEVLRLMNLPKRDRINDGVPSVPAGTTTYNKTGTTGRVVGDKGILVAKTKDGEAVPYVIVGIVQRSSKKGDYKAWMHRGGNAIRAASDIIYRHLKTKYGLK